MRSLLSKVKLCRSRSRGHGHVLPNDGDCDEALVWSLSAAGAAVQQSGRRTANHRQNSVGKGLVQIGIATACHGTLLEFQFEEWKERKQCWPRQLSETLHAICEVCGWQVDATAETALAEQYQASAQLCRLAGSPIPSITNCAKHGLGSKLQVDGA